MLFSKHLLQEQRKLVVNTMPAWLQMAGWPMFLPAIHSIEHRVCRLAHSHFKGMLALQLNSPTQQQQQRTAKHFGK